MRSQLIPLNILLLGGISLLPTQPSPAQNPSVPLPAKVPLDLNRLKKGAAQTYSVTTGNISSQHDLIIPRLWWTKEQFGDKLVDNWLVIPSNNKIPGRIDLLVNQQMWSSLDYLKRYEFVNHFGSVAREYHYNLRIFDYQKALLATYTCNFNTTPKLCNIKLEATSTVSLSR